MAILTPTAGRPEPERPYRWDCGKEVLRELRALTVNLIARDLSREARQSGNWHERADQNSASWNH